MDDAELQFIQALGISQQQLGELPDFMVRTERGKVRLALRSKLERVITFHDWAVITISPQDFVNMSKSFFDILDDLQKKTNC